jgi:hypothetical protein
MRAISREAADGTGGDSAAGRAERRFFGPPARRREPAHILKGLLQRRME